MRTEITPGRISDCEGYDLVMADNLPALRVRVADKGYDSDRIREKVEADGGVSVIPMRRNRKLRVPVDAVLYAWRNLVERCLNRVKHIRRLGHPLGQDRRQLPRLHRYRLHPPLGAPFVNMTYEVSFTT